MMKRTRFSHIALGMLLSLFVIQGGAFAQTDIGGARVSGEITPGAQQKVVHGASEKFEEYRDVQDGILLHDLRLRIDGVTTPWYLDMRMQNPVQDNESYELKAGRLGRYGVSLFYDSLPHRFATGRLVLSGAGTSQLRIENATQALMEANDLLRVGRGTNPLTPQAFDIIQQGVVADLLATVDPTTFQFKREKTGFAMHFNITDDFKTWARVSNEKRNGTRVITTGTYERYAQNTAAVPPVHLADFFLVSGTELAEPIDYRTTVVNVGTGVYRRSWLADVQYTFTHFDNEYLALSWENPFRSTDLAASNAAGLSTTSAGDFNRGRFAVGQLSLPPDSQSHDVTASASIELPLHGRLAGTVSYGWIIQDEPFVAYTRNTALTGTNVAAFAGPANITDPATVLATSGHSNLDGDVRTLSQSYSLSLRPVDPLTVTAKYRYYDYDNKSDRIVFPGYAAFGESFWRTGSNDPRAAANAGAPSSPLSYTRHTADLGLDYHPFTPLTLSLEGGWELWDRENLRIDSTEEFSAGAGFTLKAIQAATLSGRYRYGHRTVEGYLPGNTAENPEAIGQVNFDWAERKRHLADVRLMITPFRLVTFTITGKYGTDRYGEDNRFGLKRSETIMGGVDLTYNPSERITLYANYAWDYNKQAMQAAAKDNAVAGENWFPRNYWNSDIYEKVNTGGVGATFQIVPARLSLDSSYNVSYSKMDFRNVNPFADPGALANAVAQPWPRVRNRYQEVRADLGYHFTPNLKAGLRYLFEWYKLDDFVNTPAYMAGVSAENSTKFIFTGANQFSYEAHVGGAYMTYQF